MFESDIDRSSLFNQAIARQLWPMLDKNYFRWYTYTPANPFIKYTICPAYGIKYDDIDKISYAVTGEYENFISHNNIILIRMKDGLALEPKFVDVLANTKYGFKNMTVFIFEHNNLCSENMSFDKLYTYIHDMLDFIKPEHYRPIMVGDKKLDLEEYVNLATDYQIYEIICGKCANYQVAIEDFVRDTFDNCEQLKSRYKDAEDYINTIGGMKEVYEKAKLK